ncbi:SAF domain-containing protein [Actinomadura sp. 9N407]|uniref:SAF domain-containing protein n=1 Tax=Actinomadura sp. 9N407 TaxID=3375154 RepID=UPI0037A530E7
MKVRFRRPLAALTAATGTGCALLAVQTPGTEVLVAARDLPAGATLRPGDVRSTTLPSSAIPAGALRARPDRPLNGPMRRGEPLTDARITSDDLLEGYGRDTVAAPVRIADAATVKLLHIGDRVDVLAVRPPAGTLVAAAVPIVAIPRRSPGQGALIVLATTRPQAAALAGAGSHLAVSMTRSW